MVTRLESKIVTYLHSKQFGIKLVEVIKNLAASFSSFRDLIICFGGGESFDVLEHSGLIANSSTRRPLLVTSICGSYSL